MRGPCHLLSSKAIADVEGMMTLVDDLEIA